jgi:hypothetical protein
MNVDLSSILLWVLQIAISAGVILAFFGLAPAKLGERLLGHYLDQRLSSVRHEQNAKIEELKAQLAHLSDRGTRSNEREYNALMAVWDKFVEAYLSTHTCIVSFIQHPDLNRLDNDEINAFLSSEEMSDRQRQAIFSASDKNKAYSDVVQIRQINRALKDTFDTRILLRKQDIFIPKALSDIIVQSLDLFTKAQVQRQMEFQHRERFGATDASVFLEEAPRRYELILTAVRERLLATKPSAQ